jgi:hypothetical protein
VTRQPPKRATRAHVIYKWGPPGHLVGTSCLHSFLPSFLSALSHFHLCLEDNYSTGVMGQLPAHASTFDKMLAIAMKSSRQGVSHLQIVDNHNTSSIRDLVGLLHDNSRTRSTGFAQPHLLYKCLWAFIKRKRRTSLLRTNSDCRSRLYRDMSSSYQL